MNHTTSLYEYQPSYPSSASTDRLPAGHQKGTPGASDHNRPKWMKPERWFVLRETGEVRLTALLHRYGAAIDH